MRTFPIALLAIASMLPVQGATSQAHLAETLVRSHAEATQPAELESLLRLQLAAHQWESAETTIDRLTALHRATQPGRAHALAPWRIYARARRYETESPGRVDGLALAFGELFAALPDREMAAVLPWFGPDLNRLRDAQTLAGEACTGIAIDTCANAAQLIAARQALATWQYLIPAIRPLIEADLKRRFVIDDDLLIAMPDGAPVAAILVRPRGTTAKLTALLSFTIYARDDWSLSDAVTMAARGYAGIVAYTRGKGRSPGPAIPYEHDGADAAAVIDWLARQSWSDGRVGMFSGSYNASTQWGAVKHRPRALKAIATHASNAPGIDTPMQGNVFQNFTYPWPLYTTGTDGLDAINYGDRARWAALDRIWYVTGRPYRDLERIDGHPNPVFATWLEHPAYDSYWQRFIPVGKEFADVDIPVFVQTGYFDGGMVGALHYAREHFRHRPDADHRMLIGPYHHVAMTQGVLTNVDGYDVDKAALIDLQEIRMQWIDHVFRGSPLPEILSGRVNFEVMGANRWRHVDSLAAMAEEPMRLFLTSRLEEERFRFTSVPARDSGSPLLTVNLAERRDIDVQIPADELDTRNALVFVTDPLPRAIEVAGGFSGRFEIITNKRDFDLSVLFFEQAADGRYFPLASYLGRASFMADRSRRNLLTPNRRETLAFESQTVTARRVEKGSRILALVGVPRQSGMQINYGTGRDVSDESIADAGEPLTIRWRPGSYLELRVRR